VYMSEVTTDRTRGYDYYANQVFNQAVYDGDVNHHSMQEVIDYADEIADLLVIDEDELRDHVMMMAQQRLMKGF